MSFSISSPSETWYPASGDRYYASDGVLGNVGYGGCYWSASPNSNFAYYLGFYSHNYVDPSGNGSRSYGYSVRCLQVIDEVAGANAEE